MNADWDEIKRLASDFQKIQLTTTLQKLSERNCIEIVSLLIEKGLIDVIYTTDGKEYITYEHLEKEILDELYVSGGRINLVELSKILSIDLIKITPIAEKIANKNKDKYFILGQLINENYILRIATEINEKLSQHGQISISDLTIQFDLPSDFLQEKIVSKYLGKIIRGRQDPSNPRVLFTQAYILRCKSKIRGALVSITRPVSVASILQQIHIEDKLFHSLFEQISPAGIVTSKLSNAQYIPHVYAKMQSEWTKSFYKQNGFLEYDSISKLGISDPKQFIKKQFPDEDITFLEKCAVGSKIIDLTILSALNECNLTKSCIDLTTILPTNISDEDIEQLFNILKKSGKISNNFIYLESVAFTTQYLDNLVQPCKELAIAKAKKSIDDGIYQQYIIEKQLNNNKNNEQDLEHYNTKADKREERRRKAASGKDGGGTQGRETKTRSVKKHQRGGGVTDKNLRDDDYDDNNHSSKSIKNNQKSLILITFDEIENMIKKKLEEEDLEHLSTEITKLYHESINQLGLQTAQTLYESTPQTNRRQTYAALQEKLNVILVDIRLYEKGLKVLPSETQSQLIKYLLKTLGTDICNEISLYVANECNLNYKTSSLTVEQRNKIIQECEMEYKSALNELNKSLNKNSIEEFLSSAENTLKSYGMSLKKIDKKKDRLIISQHKDKLLQQLDETNDPALILHLCTLILFTNVTGNIIHASGKFVSQLLIFLKTHLNDKHNSILTEYHDLVLKYLNLENESEEKKDLLEKLNDLKNDICNLVKNYEKIESNANKVE